MHSTNVLLRIIMVVRTTNSPKTSYHQTCCVLVFENSYLPRNEHPKRAAVSGPNVRAAPEVEFH